MRVLRSDERGVKYINLFMCACFVIFPAALVAGTWRLLGDTAFRLAGISVFSSIAAVAFGRNHKEWRLYEDGYIDYEE